MNTRQIITTINLSYIGLGIFMFIGVVTETAIGMMFCFGSFLILLVLEVWKSQLKTRLAREDNMKYNEALKDLIDQHRPNPPGSRPVLEKNIQNNIDVVKKYVNINAIFSNIKDLNRNNGMKNALKMNVDYYWLIDTTFVITNKNTLLNLLLNDKGIITSNLKCKS